ITASNLYADLYLLDTAAGQIERLTKNRGVAEGPVNFSPEGLWVAFKPPGNTGKYGMTNGRVYLRRIADHGQPFRKLGSAFDGDAGIAFWSKDGGTIYFKEGIRATKQIMALDVKTGAVKQLTEDNASLS